MPRGLEVAAGAERALVLLPGFVIRAQSYAGLASPLVASDPGLPVVVPQLYRVGPGVLTGRHPVAQEAQAAATWWLTLAGRGRRCGWQVTPAAGWRRSWQPRSSRRQPGPRAWS
jgi:hypothetical protein